MEYTYPLFVQSTVSYNSVNVAAPSLDEAAYTCVVWAAPTPPGPSSVFKPVIRTVYRHTPDYRSIVVRGLAWCVDYSPSVPGSGSLALRVSSGSYTVQSPWVPITARREYGSQWLVNVSTELETGCSTRDLPYGKCYEVSVLLKADVNPDLAYARFVKLSRVQIEAQTRELNTYSGSMLAIYHKEHYGISSGSMVSAAARFGFENRIQLGSGSRGEFIRL